MVTVLELVRPLHKVDTQTHSRMIYQNGNFRLCEDAPVSDMVCNRIIVSCTRLQIQYSKISLYGDFSRPSRRHSQCILFVRARPPLLILKELPLCSIVHLLAPPAPLILQLHHPGIVPLQFVPPLSLRSIDYKDDPKHPDSSRDETVCYNDACALSSQRETEKTVNQPGGDEKAAEPDVDVRVWTRRLVALVLEMMDVAEDGLED